MQVRLYIGVHTMKQHEAGFIPIPNTDNKYLCSSSGQVAVYDDNKQQYRLLSGAVSPNGLKYYWIQTLSYNFPIKFYQQQALELFTKPHGEIEYYIYTKQKSKKRRSNATGASLKPRLEELKKQYLSGKPLSKIAEDEHIAPTTLRAALRNDLGEDTYNELAKVYSGNAQHGEEVLKQKLTNKQQQILIGKNPGNGDLNKFF